METGIDFYIYKYSYRSYFCSFWYCWNETWGRMRLLMDAWHWYNLNFAAKDLKSVQIAFFLCSSSYRLWQVVGSAQSSACANVEKHRFTAYSSNPVAIRGQRSQRLQTLPPKASLERQGGARSVGRVSSEVGVKCPSKSRGKALAWNHGSGL